MDLDVKVIDLARDLLMTVILIAGPMLVVGLVVALSGVAAQAWVSTLQIRSDRILSEQPHRMPTAEARMHPLHVRAVAAVGPSQESMRAILGDWAVPPPG